jgi:hypothetical protein
MPELSSLAAAWLLLGAVFVAVLGIVVARRRQGRRAASSGRQAAVGGAQFVRARIGFLLALVLLALIVLSAALQLLG